MKARNSVREEEIQEAILKHCGPFVTPKRIYRKFSSRTRPDADIVRAEMAKLEQKGLATCNYKIPLLELERLFRSQCEGGNCGWERKNLCGVVLGVKGTKVNARGKGRRKI